MRLFNTVVSAGGGLIPSRRDLRVDLQGRRIPSHGVHARSAQSGAIVCRSGGARGCGDQVCRPTVPRRDASSAGRGRPYLDPSTRVDVRAGHRFRGGYDCN
jgi:hypothetical protein